MNLQTSDSKRDDYALGYPDRFKNHLSQSEADRQLLQECDQGLQKFIDALQMKQPVSKHHGLVLLEDLVRDNAGAHVDDVASVMRAHNWNSLLAGGENLMDVAQRAFDFLNSHLGIETANAVMKVVAKVNDDMWTTHDTPSTQIGG